MSPIPRPGPELRRWGRRLAVAWVLVLAVLLGLPLVDVTGGRVPVLQALWNGWLCLGLLTLAIFLALRLWRTGAALALLCVVTALPILTAGASGHVASGAATLTVLSINLDDSRGRASDVQAAVERVHPDVLILAEVDQQYLSALRARIGTELRYGWQESVAGGPAGTALLSRLPLGGATVPDWSRYRFQTPSASVRVGNAEVLVRGIHLWAPAPQPAGEWRAELTSLKSWVSSVPAGRPVVMAGDFNAGQAHPGFRSLVSGLSVAPSWWSRTWPVGDGVPTFVDIDHVIARGLVPVRSGVIDIRGSDHRGVWARLALES